MCEHIHTKTGRHPDGTTFIFVYIDGEHVHTIKEKRFGPEFSQELALKWLRRKKLVPVIFNGESLAEHCQRHGIKFTEE